MTSHAAAWLDAFPELAALEPQARARLSDEARPVLGDEPGIVIRGGRHPVIEQCSDEPFVPNDVTLDDSQRMLFLDLFMAISKIYCARNCKNT